MPAALSARHLRHGVPAREAEAGVSIDLSRGDREREDEIVIGAFSPVQGVFRALRCHFEAEIDEFPGQERRMTERSGGLQAARLQQDIRRGDPQRLGARSATKERPTVKIGRA